MAVPVVSTSRFPALALSFTAMFCALAISTPFSFEPINLVKMLGLFVGASILLPNLILMLLSGDKFFAKSQKFILLMCLLFSIFQLVNLLVHRDKFWEISVGVFGRNNGVVCYLALIVLFISSTQIARTNFPLMMRLFEISGNLVLGYATIQILGLDPINWSAEGPFSTLGNLNFSAAFMAMHASSLLTKIFVKPSLPWHTKVWYLLTLLLELFVIWRTTSIQGLAMILIVASLLLHRLIPLKGTLKIAISLAITFCMGILAFLGSLGIGPLGSLKQDTMLFRLDYWTAGLSMAQQFPLFGVGMDAYGNFYRQYRNEDAANRNYFDRTANAAHSIPIDVLSGAGLVAGLCYFVILFYCLFISFRNLIFSKEKIKVQISAVSIGFLFQQFVSINQIGVSAWGWIFLGLLVGKEFNQEPDIENSALRKRKEEKVAYGKQNERTSISKIGSRPIYWFMVSISFVPTLIFGLIPFNADMRFSKALKSAGINDQWQVASGSGGNQYLMEYVLKNAVASNNPKTIYEYAKVTSERYPRSFYAWNVRAGLITSSMTERQAALDILRSLDPLNTEIPTRPIQG